MQPQTGNKARFELYRDQSKEKEFRWRLIAPNGEIIADGEGYTTKQECKEGVEAIKEYASPAEVVDLVAASN